MKNHNEVLRCFSSLCKFSLAKAKHFVQTRVQNCSSCKFHQGSLPLCSKVIHGQNHRVSVDQARGQQRQNQDWDVVHFQAFSQWSRFADDRLFSSTTTRLHFKEKCMSCVLFQFLGPHMEEKKDVVLSGLKIVLPETNNKVRRSFLSADGTKRSKTLSHITPVDLRKKIFKRDSASRR